MFTCFRVEMRRMIKITCLTAVMLGLSILAGMAMALNPLRNDDWDLDMDEDGLINFEEFLAGSDPNNYDTDGDGLPDGWEVENALDPTDPKDASLDNDYFNGEEYSNYIEVDPPYDNYAEYYRPWFVHVDTGEQFYKHTDPNNPDTDGDGILDPDDRYPLGFPPPPPPPPPIPEDPDSGGEGEGPAQGGDGDGDGDVDDDGDGITDTDEMNMGTDFNNPDTDGDGLWDNMELSLGLDPNDWDTDNDMLIDGVERGGSDSTDGHLTDTDNDGIQ